MHFKSLHFHSFHSFIQREREFTFSNKICTVFTNAFQHHTLGGSPNLLYKPYTGSDEHRKNGRFRPLGERKPLNRFWWDLAWLTMSGTPHHMTTMVGVAQRRWSGQICDSSHLWVSFFSLFFAFFSASSRISWPWPIGTIYTPKRVFPAKDLPFVALDNATTFRDQTPKTPPANDRAGIGISQPNRQK